MYKVKILALLILIFSSCKNHESESINTSWKLDKSRSNISLISTKNISISEVFEFEQFDAKINGLEFNLTINMSSINSGIEIRDQRLREFLFEIEHFPNTEVRAKLDKKHFSNDVHSIGFDLDAHGVSLLMNHQIQVISNKDSLSIFPYKPLILVTKKLGFDQGFDKLIELAGLQSINTSVPIHFVLTFTRSDN